MGLSLMCIYWVGLVDIIKRVWGQIGLWDEMAVQ